MSQYLVHYLVQGDREKVQPLVDSSYWPGNTVEREAVGEAAGADEAEALVLGAGTAVPDDDGAAHRAGAAREDLRRPRAPTGWLWHPHWPNRHGSLASKSEWEELGVGPLGCGLRSGRRTDQPRAVARAAMGFGVSQSCGTSLVFHIFCFAFFSGLPDCRTARREAAGRRRRKVA